MREDSFAQTKPTGPCEDGWKCKDADSVNPKRQAIVKSHTTNTHGARRYRQAIRRVIPLVSVRSADEMRGMPTLTLPWKAAC
jgi:hypothetical protein